MWRYLLLFYFFTTFAYAFPRGTHEVTITPTTGIRSDLLQNIAPLIEKSIAENNYPGAVILASHRGHIFYKGVFGNRRITPDVAPMRFNTIFDIASLTKVVVTTPAIMQLVEQLKIELDSPVKKYWNEFSGNGKENITIRELLTHTSGLIDIPEGDNKQQTLEKIQHSKLIHPPGSTFSYSDANFIVLGHLVEIVSGKSLNDYAEHHIFKPLKMNDTSYLPSASLHNRIAPTEIIQNQLRWGEVHDPIAHAMGGISGNAGLFSTANDLSHYAQCLLNNGRLPKENKKPTSYLLGPLTVLKMTTSQTPLALTDNRGLGWDTDSVYSNRGILFPIRSFGHTGWTGTSIWIDPATQTYIIILTSRLHPKPVPTNTLIHDRRAIANIIAASITDVSTVNLNNTSENELHRAYTQTASSK